MSLVAVFSDSLTTYIVADTLVTNVNDSDFGMTENKWMSTGVYLDNADVVHYKHDEGPLKIGIIQPNLAMGFAGDVSFALAALQLIYDYSTIHPIKSFDDFVEFFQEKVISSLSPIQGDCCFCGFINEGSEVRKFKIYLSSISGLTVESTTNRDEAYVVGTGEQEFLSIWEHVPKADLEGGIEPSLMFSIISEPLYAKQFVGETDLITKLHVGGAITGLYIHEGRIQWQPSKTVTVFSNVGGVGFDADFRWLRIIYKTWSEHNNFFSSSFFEQNGRYFQRITLYSNPTSSHLTLSTTSLTKEMKTFNSNETFVLLLPKGISSQFPSVIKIYGQLKAFDEIYKNNIVEQIRLNEDFLKKVSDYFFVADDYTIKIDLDRLPYLINALKKNLLMLSKDREPDEWVKRQGEIAVRLMEYGGKKNDIHLLSEALERFIDAHEVASLSVSNLVVDTKYNLEQFLRDLRQNLNPHQLSAVLSNNQDALNRCRDEIDFGS